MKRIFPSLLLLAPSLHAQIHPSVHEAHAGEIVFLENYVVSATPSARAQAELAQATTVLAGHALATRLQPTLGDTLAFQPGISAASHGPGASRPVIRGIGGERVRILENGSGSFDAAGLSPDHATSVEPLFAERIEIVRGPAALMFGSAASGGVVNVIDARIPTREAERPLSLDAAARYRGATDGISGAIRAGGGADGLAWSTGITTRDARDLRVPDDAGGRVDNSFVRTKGGFIGGARFWEGGRAGAAVTLYSTRYGVPGEEPVTIALDQRRVDVRAAAGPLDWWFDSVKADLSAANYEHTEFEDGEAGTVFTQEAVEARLELPWTRGDSVTGSLGVHLARTDLTAEGDEAYVPPSRTSTAALFAYESHRVGSLLLEVGARVERQDIKPGISGLRRRDDTVVSASAGAIWNIDDTWSLAASAMRTTRPPNATELFANGPHVATGGYEIGASDLLPERGDSFEVTLRKRQGWFEGAATVFENRIERFIFRSPTGDIEDDLPVFAYRQADARYHGLEVETVVHLHESETGGLDLKLGADAVRAVRRSDREPLPNIPPARLLAGLRFASGAWLGGVDLVRSAAQRRVAEYETETSGYTLVGADIAWRRRIGLVDWEIILRADNLADRVARNHVSLLKDIVPLAGRDISVSVHLTF